MSIRLTVVLGLLSIMLISGVVYAQGVPNAITYQGKLTNTVGEPVPDAVRSVVFNFYTSSVGSMPIWTSGAIPVTTVGGGEEYQLDGDSEVAIRIRRAPI